MNKLEGEDFYVDDYYTFLDRAGAPVEALELYQDVFSDWLVSPNPSRFLPDIRKKLTQAGYGKYVHAADKAMKKFFR